MENDTTIAALLMIWDELPALAHGQWEILEQELKALLVELRNATDSTERDRISLAIQQTLEQIPEVLDRFDDAFVQLSQSNATQTRGDLSRSIARIFERGEPVAKGAPQAGKEFIRYTDITCPRRVWVKTRRVVVVVRLLLQPSSYSEVTEQLVFQNLHPVRVRIEAPGFTLTGPGELDISLLPETDSPPIVFDLCPQQVCATHVTLDFFQLDNPIGTASVPVEITAEEVGMTSEVSAGPLLGAGTTVKAPDFLLYITYERFLTPPALSFELRTAGGVGQKFAPIELRGVTPEVYANQIYRRLTILAKQLDPTLLSVLGEKRLLAPQDAEERLREEGQNLWRDLIPLELQARYAAEREQWRDKSLLIVSDEPYIPWELLWPYDSQGVWKEDEPLCLCMCMARWLRREAQGHATYEPEPSLYLHTFALLAPSDSGLPAAQRERVFLTSLVKQHLLVDASPSELTRISVKRLLEQGPYSWVHVASHGNFYPEDPNGESALWLEDKQPLTSSAIIGGVEVYLRAHRPGFVLNACEVGRQGSAITGLGGWANRLISAGAGLFLAPLWIVNDRAALQFSKALYRGLLSGQPIAEAVRQGRKVARQEGDPTWLAYSLYAHPNASVKNVPNLPKG